MTFDEAVTKFEQEANNFAGLVPMETVYEIILDLRDEYAPSVEMTKEQRKGLLFDGKGRETPHKNFVFMKEVQKVNEKNINIDILMSAFVHPETIKVVEENKNDN